MVFIDNCGRTWEWRGKMGIRGGNVGTGGNALEYKGINLGINNIVDIKGGVWCHEDYNICHD